MIERLGIEQRSSAGALVKRGEGERDGVKSLGQDAPRA
jgi:hypothetical protein